MLIFGVLSFTIIQILAFGYWDTVTLAEGYLLLYYKIYIVYKEFITTLIIETLIPWILSTHPGYWGHPGIIPAIGGIITFDVKLPLRVAHGALLRHKDVVTY